MSASRKTLGGRVACTAGVTSALMVLGANAAVAESVPVQSAVGMPIGTVGIGAVVVGVGGIVVGLLRRKKAPVIAANARVEQVVVPLTVPVPRVAVEPADR
ncbi:hypothetical protein L6E12_24585 [Actinokineospora sp. PR83]|uniref:hypothetical protein n=1 Tax=Actinokineospora sp. PR83 TaxID=2884908 RepID=UPI001F34AA8A|nr:hypothetical protein [Actinokineospora sp. PR83]MCG8918962.1 hypothetical protein [Actinokineospora sp. PR83]